MALICELDEQWSFVENKARQQWHWLNRPGNPGD
ncbi:hypothetical protein HEM28_024360 [Escherichia coli]|nr:hypothetical protein [Escherichia coli]MBB7603690.1 hypothetical protein [Escherichia coli]HAH9063928.1 hypothetical protein [Escherichia coli]